MGRLLRDASIRTKVLTLVIIVAGVALVLASAALLTTGSRNDIAAVEFSRTILACVARFWRISVRYW